MKATDEKSKPYSKKFREINKEHLRKLVTSGFTDEQTADFFGITRDTLARWKRWHPEFKQQMLDWKLEADAAIEKSLYRSATGYEVIEKTSEMVKGVMMVVKEVTKHITANATAQIFWLTNRKHGDWKRTREETGADPLSVKVYQIIKNGNGKGGKNGKAKKGEKILANAEEIQSAVHVERGGVKVV